MGRQIFIVDEFTTKSGYSSPERRKEATLRVTSWSSRDEYVLKASLGLALGSGSLY